MLQLIYCFFFFSIMACQASEDYPGKEYAPQMYHSIAYEPLSQITNQQAGAWLSNREDGLGEFYNSNTYNKHAMNMREPPINTVPRTISNILPYRLQKEELSKATYLLKNPYGKEVLHQGKALYTTFCRSCHGDNGQGDGPVGRVLKGVPAYNKGRIKTLQAGHIFHVITHGYGRMGAHASQITTMERWKIVHYVQTLQH